MKHDRPIVTMGEAMALFVTDGTGPLAQSTIAHIRTGGAEANVAIGLSRLGVPAVWVGRHGNDPFGARVIRELQAEGVHVISVADASAPTGLMIREQRVSSRSRVWYYRKDYAGSRLSPADLPANLIENAAVLHLTGITPALSSSALASVHEAIGRARSASVPISFDVNYRSRLWSTDEAARELRDLSASSDVVFAGIEEAQLITGSRSNSPDELASAIADQGIREVVIKLGELGAQTLHDGRTTYVEAIPANVVDTVGAGDAFVAAYLSQRVAEASVSDRLQRAVLAASIVCESDGDWEGFPTLHELGLLSGRDAVIR